jgi:hypothetical protein
MTLRKPAIAAVAAVAALTGGLAIADTAAAQTWRGGNRGASWSFSIQSGPGYGYYGRGYGYRPYRYGYARPYYAPPARYYAPRGYGYRGARWRGRGCARWVWDGWRQTYVMVRGRC